jgi:hypothetical protein
LAAALSGTVPQQLRPSPLFEDLAARPVGTTTAVKLFHGDEIPAVGATANPSVTAPRDEANVPPRAGQMVWSTPQNLRQPVAQPPPAQPAPSARRTPRSTLLWRGRWMALPTRSPRWRRGPPSLRQQLGPPPRRAHRPWPAR